LLPRQLSHTHSARASSTTSANASNTTRTTCTSTSSRRRNTVSIIQTLSIYCYCGAGCYEYESAAGSRRILGSAAWRHTLLQAWEMGEGAHFRFAEEPVRHGAAIGALALGGEHTPGVALWAIRCNGVFTDRRMPYGQNIAGQVEDQVSAAGGHSPIRAEGAAGRGLHQRRIVAGALEGEELKAKIADAHFVGIRSRTQLTADVFARKSWWPWAAFASAPTRSI
jgi:hypothetical protein